MEEVEFQVFIHEENKSRAAPNTVLLTAFVISFGATWLSSDYLGKDNFFYTVALYITLVILIVTMGFIFFSFFTYQPLSGILEGEIVFKEDRIVLNGNVFELNEIDNVDFDLRDFYGKSSRLKVDLNPRMSQGVNNNVSFSDKANQSQKIYFKLTTKLHYQELIPFINQAIRLKKMDLKRGIDLVGVENIQTT